MTYLIMTAEKGLADAVWCHTPVFINKELSDSVSEILGLPDVVQRHIPDILEQLVKKYGTGDKT